MSENNKQIRVRVGLDKKTFDNLNQRAQHVIDQHKQASGNIAKPNQFTTSPVGTHITGVNKVTGKSFSAVNFASEDFLGVAQHPGSIHAAVNAYKDLGTHSGGSPLFYGVTEYSEELSACFLKYFQGLIPNCSFSFYSSGFLAKFGAIRGNNHTGSEVDYNPTKIPKKQIFDPKSRFSIFSQIQRRGKILEFYMHPSSL